MTDQVTLPRTVVEQTLEAAHEAIEELYYSNGTDEAGLKRANALLLIEEARAALDNAEQQEATCKQSLQVQQAEQRQDPTECRYPRCACVVDLKNWNGCKKKAPQAEQRQEAWQGLSDEEKYAIYTNPRYTTPLAEIKSIVRTIEAQLRAKNGGVK